MISEENYRLACLMAEGMRVAWKASDDRRDSGLKTPDNVVRTDNLLYGPYGRWNSMDIYYPLEAVRKPEEGGNVSCGAAVITAADADGVRSEWIVDKPLPTIISIHGGGWQYGDKDLYQYYTMSLAGRGFAVINFTYRLAPENAIPAEFTDVNRLFNWYAVNAAKYGLDSSSTFVLGDSAGGHMTSWYLTILTSSSYRELYRSSFPDIAKGLHRQMLPFTAEDLKRAGEPEENYRDIPAENMVPDEEYIFDAPADKIRVRACALNCGIYDVLSALGIRETGELSGDGDKSLRTCVAEWYENDPALVTALLDSYGAMTKDFPPAFIMSASHDFLCPMAEPMRDYLSSLGVQTKLKIYGTPEQEYMAHVFHENLRLAEAKECNDDECAFFRSFLS